MRKNSVAGTLLRLSSVKSFCCQPGILGTEAATMVSRPRK
jgi:hypothetical protein